MRDGSATMRSVRQMWRVARIAFFALVGWLTAYGAAWAAQPAPPPKAGESVGSGVYVMAYFLVILGIALGILFVCRSSNRRERVRPEQFGESKALKKEDE